MQKWQRYWLYIVIGFSIFHIVRDVLQVLGVHTFIADIVTRAKPKGFWGKFFWSGNTFVIEAAALTLSIMALRKGQFGIEGWLTILIAVGTTIGFAVYFLVP